MNRRGVPAVWRKVLPIIIGLMPGIAIGAYGTRVTSAVAIHLPVEFGALSLTGGAYMQACQQPLRARELVAVAAMTGLLLIVAAALETYVSLGGLG